MPDKPDKKKDNKPIPQPEPTKGALNKPEDKKDNKSTEGKIQEESIKNSK